jgi:cobyrinic acid a,c-diamide synthase
MTDGLLGRIAKTVDAADIVIAEGSMGLFDAVPGRGRAYRRRRRYRRVDRLAGRARHRRIGAAQSVAAVALGCKLYDPRIRIAGVILNKVASTRHERLVRQGMERIGLPVLGALPRKRA